MGSVVVHVGEVVVSEMLEEAVEELTGRSKRKWAVVLIAFVLGGVVAVVVIKSRKRRAAETGSGPDAVTVATASDSEARG